MVNSGIEYLVIISIISTFTPTTSLTPALLLTPFIHQNRTEEARISSLVNPSLFLNVTSYSGFLTVDERYNSNTFFWYFPVAGKPVNETPWVLWLQGGPGATSLAGLFDEIGPFEYDGKLKLRESPWSKDHSLLFIDNPLGAGYSFTNSDEGFARDMPTYTKHLFEAVQQFLTIFPELRTAPLYIAGESYAGRYVPALGEHILDALALDTKQQKNSAINLQGLIMGNPVLDRDSIANYSSIFYQWGLIDPQGVRAVKSLQDKYSEAVRRRDNNVAFNTYTDLLEKLQDIAFVKQKYNILTDEYDLKKFIDYLMKEEVKEAIHVGDIKFTFSNYTAQVKLTSDFVVNVETKVQKLLEHCRILIYCGQLDLTAPCVPNAEDRRRRWFWSRRHDFLQATRQPWWYNESLAGYVKSGGGLTEVLVRGAGHLVPIDKPARASQLVSYFIRGLDLPAPPNYSPNSSDTPEYEVPSDKNSSGDKVGMIVSIVINVVLLLVIFVGIYLYVKLKRRSEAFFYSSVDRISDDIFLS